ncbi:transthyretin-like family protein [Microbulbifer aggregans]|uniref:transthyretin-like family protein n=1 Tax=Microbulbifer aggregans TaxID=1769779 RepID=UPI001CFD2E9E|nr:transthyretin-like family protein [Microbulbifer aggregans]
MKNKRYETAKTVLLTAFLLTFIPVYGNTMSILDAGKAYFFSPVTGTLTKDEKPVTNAKIIRRWEHESLEQDETSTDENGNFTFPEVRRRTLVQMLPAEFVVAQQIAVVQGDEEIVIWSNSKRDSGKNSELGGKDLDLYCDLDNEEAMYRDFGAALFTKCTWK